MKNIVLLFKALSDETRLRILALLQQGELCVCDLMAALELPQSTVSRHLAYLKNAGLVDDRRQGVWMFYRLFFDGNDLDQELLALLSVRLDGLVRIRKDKAALEILKSSRVESCL